MLILPTKPNSAYLLNLAGHLLQSNPSRIDEALILVELSDIAGRITSIDDFNVRFRIANLLLDRGQTEKAKKLFSETEVKKAYSENIELKDVYSRIGWAFYWPQKDYAKVIEWFDKDRYFSDNHQQTSDTYSPDSRLSPIWRLNYAQVLADTGDIVNAEKQVAMAYAENPVLKDGYSRVAWSYFADKNDYSSIRIWIKRDEDSNRLSLAWRLNQAKAVANTEGIEAALPLIEKAYNENPDLQNAYGQVAWSHYIPEDMAYEKVLTYFEKDAQHGRLRGEWQLNYAQALMAIGREDEAERLVEEVYQKDENTNNGFARCGYFRYFVFKYEPEKALLWFDRDFRLGRLTGNWNINHATVLAAIGEIDEALSMVERFYKKDAKSANGYAQIAWYGHIIRNHDPEKAMATFKRDQQLNRSNSSTDNLLFGIHTYLGNRKEAERLIGISYERNQTINGSHSIVGCCDYLRTGDLDYLFSMLKKDDSMKRLRVAFLSYIYAAVLLKYGEDEKSKFLFDAAIKRSYLSANLAKTWLNRIGYADKKCITNLINFANPSAFV